MQNAKYQNLRQRVKRDKRTVMCAQMVRSIAEDVQLYVRKKSSYVADHAFRRNGLVSIPAESNELGRLSKKGAKWRMREESPTEKAGS